MAEAGSDYRSRTFAAGKVIFREGEPGREAYLVKRGRVTLSRLLEGTETVLATVGPGAVFGEMAVLGEGPRSASAVAEEEAELVVIDHQALEAGLAQSPPLVRRLMEHFQERLLVTTGRLSPRSEGEAVRRVAEVVELLARARAAEAGGWDPPALSQREVVERARQATGMREEEIRGALARLEADGEVECGPRKGGDHRFEKVVRVGETERLARRVAGRTAAWSQEAGPPEPPAWDLWEAAEALGLAPEAVLERLMAGELPPDAVRLRPERLPGAGSRDGEGGAE